MKTTVSVIALQSFEWKGQSYSPEQTVNLTPIDAVVLSRKRLVTLTRRKAKQAPVVPPPPVVEPEPELPKRRYYKRKDIQAEDIAPVVDVVTPADPEAEF